MQPDSKSLHCLISSGYPVAVRRRSFQTYWTEEAENALEELESGAEDALRSYRDMCTIRLNKLIEQARLNCGLFSVIPPPM